MTFPGGVCGGMENIHIYESINFMVDAREGGGTGRQPPPLGSGRRNGGDSGEVGVSETLRVWSWKTQGGAAALRCGVPWGGEAGEGEGGKKRGKEGEGEQTVEGERPRRTVEKS